MPSRRRISRICSYPANSVTIRAELRPSLVGAKALPRGSRILASGTPIASLHQNGRRRTSAGCCRRRCVVRHQAIHVRRRLIVGACRTPRHSPRKCPRQLSISRQWRGRFRCSDAHRAQWQNRDPPALTSWTGAIRRTHFELTLRARAVPWRSKDGRNCRVAMPGTISRATELARRATQRAWIRAASRSRDIGSASRGLTPEIFSGNALNAFAGVSQTQARFPFRFFGIHETLRPSRLAMRGASRSSRTWRRDAMGAALPQHGVAVRTNGRTRRRNRVVLTSRC